MSDSQNRHGLLLPRLPRLSAIRPESGKFPPEWPEGRPAQVKDRQQGGPLMAVYKRGDKWWYHFSFRGERFQESTKQSNKRIAEQMEAARKTQLAKGELGIQDRPAVPTLKEFAPRFEQAIELHCAGK